MKFSTASVKFLSFSVFQFLWFCNSGITLDSWSSSHLTTFAKGKPLKNPYGENVESEEYNNEGKIYPYFNISLYYNFGSVWCMYAI